MNSNSTRTPGTLQSLRECAKQLSDEAWLGSKAPAYITLKRWAKRNLLNSARAHKPGVHHPQYRLDELARIARARHGQDEAKPELADAVDARLAQQIRPPVVGPEDGPSLTAVTAVTGGTTVAAVSAIEPGVLASERSSIVGTLAQIADTLVEIRNSLAGRSKQEDQLINGLTNLDATRKLLMNKYDGELTSLQKKVADLVTEKSALERLHSPIDVAKLNMIMSRVSDQLAEIAR